MVFNWIACGLMAVWVGRAGGHFDNAPRLTPMIVFLIAPLIVFWSGLHVLRERRHG